MDLTLISVVVLVVAVLVALAWAFQAGGTVERAIAGRDRAEAQAKAVVELSRMHAEAERIEGETRALLEAELDEELSRWSATPR